MGHMVKNQTTEIRVKLCTLRADLGTYVFYGGYITHGTNTHTHTHLRPSYLPYTGLGISQSSNNRTMNDYLLLNYV